MKKPKNLFQDMMQQASFEFGFEAEDIPLMIEAIPVNADCIVLIITKVEDPDEIDTRFSKFSPSLSAEDDAAEDDITDHFSDDVLDLFQKIKNSTGAVSNTQNEEPQTAAPRMLQAGLKSSLHLLPHRKRCLYRRKCFIQGSGSNAVLSGSHNG